MRRVGLTVAALLVVAAIEVTVLVLIAQVIGPLWTILAILGTSALGAYLLRREGARAWRAFRADLAEGRPPGNAATDGVLVFVGGVAMLVPGFVTAVIGALLLIPPVRRVSRVVLLRLFGRRLSPQAATSLFGPRQVRVRYGAPHHADSDSDHQGPQNGGNHGGGEPIEGEIIDPP
jgi:UPF0716 protein FxsA